jgi:hypothetical protein
MDNKIIIGGHSNDNNKILQGKLVEFDLSLSDVIYKINLINDCKSNDIKKNTLLKLFKQYVPTIKSITHI